jgi:sugar (pentulose or hexulose) kinase
MTVVAFDVGGTRVKAGLVGPDGIGSITVVPIDVSSFPF